MTEAAAIMAQVEHINTNKCSRCQKNYVSLTALASWYSQCKPCHKREKRENYSYDSSCAQAVEDDYYMSTFSPRDYEDMKYEELVRRDEELVRRDRRRHAIKLMFPEQFPIISLAV